MKERWARETGKIPGGEFPWNCGTAKGAGYREAREKHIRDQHISGNQTTS